MRQIWKEDSFIENGTAELLLIGNYEDENDYTWCKVKFTAEFEYSPDEYIDGYLVHRESVDIKDIDIEEIACEDGSQVDVKAVKDFIIENWELSKIENQLSKQQSSKFLI